MSINTELQEWLAQNAVHCSWGEFEGIADLSIAQLGALQALVQGALMEKMTQQVKESQEDNEPSRY